MLFLLALLAAPTLASATVGAAPGGGKFCSATAKSLFVACLAEGQSDFAVATAKCTNLDDADARKACQADARGERRDGDRLCRAQLTGRRLACRALGEGRYDPQLDPAAFDDDFANPPHPNPFFPLRIGNTWEFQGGNEVNTLEVVDEKKEIAGLTAIVVRDLVKKDGHLAEATDDWYAQAKDGTVWYLGEEVKDYETFAEDLPPNPELVSVDGSFKAGRDGDKAGIIFEAAPEVGDAYLEEFSLANAEDISTVLSTTSEFGVEAELDRLVPPALAALLCPGNCVVTRNESLLEPGVSALKYYASGIGFFLEVSEQSSEILQLVSCNFDTRCAALPAP